MGGKLFVGAGGQSVQSAQTAFQNLILKRPQALLIPSFQPSEIAPQLKEAHQQGIPVSSEGILDPKTYAIAANGLGLGELKTVGRVLAAWTVQQKGTSADVVFYTVPELSFATTVQNSFRAEMTRLCSKCTVRIVNIPLASIGTDAPARVVSDLQSNPTTNVAVFSSEEAATGLPAALKAAGLTVDVTGFAPSPANLQDIKDGAIASGLGLDLPVETWSQLDAAARLAIGQQLPASEVESFAPLEMLTKSDLQHTDVADGWTGYPSYAKRFAKLWHP